MNYIKLIKIENITGFCPDKGVYSYSKGEKYYLFIDGILFEKEDGPIKIVDRKPYIYAWYGSGKLEVYDGHILLKSIERDTNLLNEQTQYIGKHFLDLKSFQTYYNFVSLTDENPILSKFTPYKLYVEDHIIIGYDNFSGEFKRINTQTETIWEYPLSLLGGTEYEPDEIDRINKILGIAHGNIWFYTNFRRLVALDLETGEKNIR